MHACTHRNTHTSALAGPYSIHCGKDQHHCVGAEPQDVPQVCDEARPGSARAALPAQAAPAQGSGRPGPHPCRCVCVRARAACTLYVAIRTSSMNIGTDTSVCAPWVC
eukprot:1159457-Pelagomonas_calceolata.AAC.8